MALNGRVAGGGNYIPPEYESSLLVRDRPWLALIAVPAVKGKMAGL
jgi:hypothetical protein